MKDRAFTGKDVAEAVREAALTLGLAESELRYFVLEPGRPGSLGVAPSPARIAVLMEAPSKRPAEREAASPPRPVPPPRSAGAESSPPGPNEPVEARLRRITEAVGRAAGLRLEGRVVLDRETAALTLETSDPAFFLGPDGEGGAWTALEQILHRALAPALHPLRLRIELLGYREGRDLELRRRTLALVEEVRRDGLARETAPLNAYERRIVHLAVATAGGVVSRSEGEGADRRVVILADPRPGPAAGEVL